MLVVVFQFGKRAVADGILVEVRHFEKIRTIGALGGFAIIGRNSAQIGVGDIFHFGRCSQIADTSYRENGGETIVCSVDDTRGQGTGGRSFFGPHNQRIVAVGTVLRAGDDMLTPIETIFGSRFLIKQSSSIKRIGTHPNTHQLADGSHVPTHFVRIDLAVTIIVAVAGHAGIAQGTVLRLQFGRTVVGVIIQIGFPIVARVAIQKLREHRGVGIHQTPFLARVQTAVVIVVVASVLNIVIGIAILRCRISPDIRIFIYGFATPGRMQFVVVNIVDGLDRTLLNGNSGGDGRTFLVRTAFHVAQNMHHATRLVYKLFP